LFHHNSQKIIEDIVPATSSENVPLTVKVPIGGIIIAILFKGVVVVGKVVEKLPPK